MPAAGTNAVTEALESGATESVDRRQALQKIAVGGAIIWGAPLIAGTAHAQAQGSACGDRLLKWSTLNQNPVVLPKTIVLNDVTVTISQSFYGGSASYSPGGTYNDRGVFNGPWGGVGSAADSFLMLYQTSVLNGGRRVTFTFTKTGTSTPKPVQNINFWITDIDYYRDNNPQNGPQYGQYDDRVTFAPSTFTRANPAGSGVTGTGTLADAFRRTGNGDIAPNAAGGTTKVTQAAPISSFVLDFWCGPGAYNAQHAIFLGDISFNSCT